MGASVSDSTAYSLIFVDDENIVREGIASRVSWGSNGFTLAGVFEDGEKALDFMRSNPVDVLLSDISMPKMDGLTLSRIAAEEFPDTMVLLLTGFEEFEYAREAIRNQVKEFLLKPITAEELEEVLKRTRMELDRRRTVRNEQLDLRRQLESSLPLLKEQLFKDLISGRHVPEGVLQNLGKDESSSQNYFCVLLFRAVPHKSPDSGLKDKIRIILREMQAEFFNVVFSDNYGNTAVLMSSFDLPGLKNNINSFIQVFQNSPIEQDAISAGAGIIVEELANLHESYNTALSAAEYMGFRASGSAAQIPAGSRRAAEDSRSPGREVKASSGRGRGFSLFGFSEEISRKPVFPEPDFALKAKMLLKALNEESMDNAIQILNDICSRINASSMTASKSYKYLNRLEYLLSDFMEEMKISRDEDMDLWKQESLLGLTLPESRNILENQIVFIEKQVSLRRKGTLVSRVEKACKIINQNYSDKNFNLSSLCDELCLGSSQFSALFKEGTGRTFVEYLTYVRINEAKKLLKTTDLRSYEIADRVGYRDPRYFSSLFRRVTGVTTTEYRQSLREL